MLNHQILNNIDCALNECCDKDCTDINIKKLMLALRQLEVKLCEDDHSKAIGNHANLLHQEVVCDAPSSCPQVLPLTGDEQGRVRNIFNCEFTNVLLLGIIIGIFVGFLVYVFNKTGCQYCY